MVAVESQKRATTGPTRPPLARVYGVQAAVLALTTMLVLLHSSHAAWSYCLGGAIAVVPNAWFAWRVFRYRGAKASMAVAQSFYRGEAGKFVLTLSGFACVFALAPSVNVVALFAGYLLMTLLNIVSAASISAGRQ